MIPTELLPPQILSKLPKNFKNLRDEAIRAMNASGKFINSRFAISSPEILIERETICRACEWWDAIAIKGTGRCRKCGCSTWAKLRMATERCPIGKWEAHLTSTPK